MRATYNLWQSKHYLQMKSPMTCMPRQFLHNVHWFCLQLLLGFFLSFCFVPHCLLPDTLVLFHSFPTNAESCWSSTTDTKITKVTVTCHAPLTVSGAWFSVDTTVGLPSNSAPAPSLGDTPNQGQMDQVGHRMIALRSFLPCLQSGIQKPEFDLVIRPVKLMTNPWWH